MFYNLRKLSYTSNVFVDYFGFSALVVISSVNIENSSSFKIFFITFSCSIALVRPSNIVLNMNGKNRHSYLIFDHKGLNIQLFRIRYVSCSVFGDVLYKSKEVSLYS